ncbi:hypothetical protein EIP91_001857 [Steccherinum ochraceum]|uniref:Uncharacterized protein n=1 Tax=Steccherinum ochraceum TaxID=92696 RepID=A0A4R0RLN5_9APHY|nr:hypothetical protein EIP91_001857 [Steccherinum ochraceum]
MRARSRVPWMSVLLLLCTFTYAAQALSSHVRAYGPVKRQVAPPQAPQPPAPDPLPPATPAAPASPQPTAPPAVPPTSGVAAIPTITSDTTAQQSIPPTATSGTLTSSSSSTASVIHITALPPAASGDSTRQRHSSSTFNSKYLAPLFAVLGVALGAFSAWLLLVIRSRCRSSRARSDSLEPGPEYTAPRRPEKADRDANRATTRKPWTTFLGGRGDPSEKWDTSKSNQSWFSRMLTKRPEQPRQRTVVPYTYASDSYSYLNEDDPFLTSTPTATTGTSSRSSDPLGRSQGNLTTSFISVGVAPTDVDEWIQGPENSMTQDKEALDRVKLGPKARRGHTRVDSDGNVLEVKASPVPCPSDVTLLCPSDGTRSIASGTTANSAQPLVEHAAAPGVGFRIVDEEAEEARAQQPGWTWTLPWVAAENASTDDRFTALPSRNVADKRKTPMIPSASPPRAQLVSSNGRPRTLSRADSSVLLANPPLLNSPPLEAQLFFSPLFGSTPSLTLAVDKVPSANGMQYLPSSDKLSSRLPFPAANVQHSTPYRRRLTKSPPSRAEGTSAPASPRPLTRTPTSASATSTGSRQIALDKVEQILAKSWSQRQIDGVASPTSPTMFGASGALVIVDSLDGMSGIEERLAEV